MKKLFQFSALIILMGVVSCKKDRSDVAPASPSPIIPPPIISPPTIEVFDTTIQLPYNRAFLAADIHTTNNANGSIEWKKIEGPDQYVLSNSIVSGLVEGIYHFEITVDQFGKIAKDTLIVTVLPDNHTYTKEVIFDNVTWSTLYGGGFAWGCTAEIENAITNIPQGAPFKVYFKTNSTSVWDIVIPPEISSSSVSGIYENSYVVDNNKLVIYNSTEVDMLPGIVKIVY